MRRAVVLLRSVIPTEPTQLLFLCGTIFLLIANQLRWWPAEVSPWVRHVGPVSLNADSAIGRSLHSWIAFVWWSGFLLYFSGAAGLFICLRPGNRPVGRILMFVCLPSFLAISLICGRFLYLARNPYFRLLDASRVEAGAVPWAVATLWQLGPGLHFGILGLLLVSIFLSRMAFGIASLPISLSDSPVPSSDSQDQWTRIWLFVLFSITCVFLANVIAGLPFLGLYYLLTLGRASGPVSWIFWFEGPIAGVLVVCAAAWAVGNDRWKSLRQFLRLPQIKYLGLGLVLPVGIWACFPMAAYLHDRVVWAEEGFGKVAPPWLSSYFEIPALQPFLTYLPAAFFEEIVWRGYLQPRFVKRYGLLRGLVVLSIAWAAGHFQTELGPGFTDSWVLYRMLWRLGVCVVLGFVFGWLTLHSGSILPAALAHGLYNVLVASSIDLFPPLGGWLEIVLWVLLAWVLFRFWPPHVADENSLESVSLAPEPLT
jgi:membrane protease YdiL (CAAX protease family)